MDERSTLIYLLRHGEILLAERRRFVGHLDVPLSPRGEVQCQRQAHRLRAVPLAAVFSSDLSRAVRSAEIIGAPHGLGPKQLPALREMDMGRWEGLTAAELEAREPAAFKAWTTRVGEYPFPDGEDVARLVARAWLAFDAIAAEHAGGPWPLSPTPVPIARSSAAPSISPSRAWSPSARTTPPSPSSNARPPAGASSASTSARESDVPGARGVAGFSGCPTRA